MRANSLLAAMALCAPLVVHSLAAAQPERREPSPPVAEWSPDECVKAIRALIGEAEGYPLKTVPPSDLDSFLSGRDLRRFEGRQSPRGSTDVFEVDIGRHLILRAYTPSRVDERFFAVGGDQFLHKGVSADDARGSALRIAEEHCPQVLKSTYKLTESVDSSPYEFTWQEIVEPWGVRLPRRVTVGIDAINGRLVLWRLKLNEVTIETKPRSTRDEIVAISKATGANLDALEEVCPEVIGRGKDQRLLWYLYFRNDHGTETVVVINDATHRIELATESM